MCRKTKIFLIALLIFFVGIVSQTLMAADPVNKAKILFTFDDGTIDNITNAAPILANAGFRATAYVTKEKAEQYWATGVMNDEQLATLYNQYGWDLGNHTVSHTDLGLSNDEASLSILRNEYLDNQNWLISLGFDRAAYHIAYPHGFYTQELIEILKNIGAKTGRTVSYGFVTFPVTDFYQLKSISVKSNNISVIKTRIDQAVLNKYTLFLVFHGVDMLTIENELYVISPEQLQEIVNHVKMYVDQGSADVLTISQWYTIASSYNVSTVANISVASNNTTYGTVSGGGTFNNGSTVTVKAVPKAGYRFVGWTEGTTTVSTNSTYQFTVNGNRSLVGNFARISTPTLSSVASAGPSSIKMTWGAISGASGYEVYRATTATGTYTKVGTTTGTSYTNTGLIAGKYYYYKVRAYATAGTVTTYGSLSAYKYAKPIPATPILTVASSGYTSIRVSWPAISGANGYQVFRATSASGTYFYIGATTGTAYNNGGLVTGKSYYYKVRAYHLEGTTKVYGSYSAYKGAQPLPGTPVISAASSGYNSIKVYWPAVAGASGYNIYRATSATGTYSYIGSSSGTSFNSTGLITGSEYHYKVKAYRKVGTSVFFGLQSASKSAKPYPSKPVLTVVKGTGNSVNVSWSAVAGGSVYQVYRATSATGTYTLVYTGGSTARSFTDAGLNTGQTYYYKMRTYHILGTVNYYSAYSIIKSITL